MHSIIPGILEKTAEDIDKKMKIINSFSRSVHIDFLDGKFAPFVSFLDLDFFKKYKEDYFMEAHLMVENPTAYIKPLSNAGFKKFIGHVEKMESLEEFTALGQVYGEVAVALDLDTPIERISISFDELDSVLIMSVKAGKSGQEFLPVALEKVKAIKEVSQIPIEIDGGINDKTIVLSRESGAERFVATSYIFGSKDPMQSFERLLSLV